MLWIIELSVFNIHLFLSRIIKAIFINFSNWLPMSFSKQIRNSASSFGAIIWYLQDFFQFPQYAGKLPTYSQIDFYNSYMTCNNNKQLTGSNIKRVLCIRVVFCLSTDSNEILYTKTTLYMGYNKPNRIIHTTSVCH